MQLKWGSFAFDANSVWVSTTSERLLSERLIPYGFKSTFKVKGWLLGSSQSDLTTKSILLQNALKVDYQDLRLVQDSGADSATVMYTANANTGLTVVDGPNFNGEAHSEYASQREFDFSVMGEFHFSDAQFLVLAFAEKLTFSGGGPLYAMKRALNRKPQRQRIYSDTEYVVVQSGTAIGLKDYPRVPESLFPFALKEAAKIERSSPDRKGFGYERYAVSWEYTHEWDGPLFGLPNRWTTVG